MTSYPVIQKELLLGILREFLDTIQMHILRKCSYESPQYIPLVLIGK